MQSGMILHVYGTQIQARTGMAEFIWDNKAEYRTSNHSIGCVTMEDGSRHYFRAEPTRESLLGMEWTGVFASESFKAPPWWTDFVHTRVKK